VAATPLARLLAMAFRSLIDDLHARLAERGWRELRPAYGFVLLAARQKPTTAGDIAELMGMSKQAASKLLGAMEAARYLRRVTDHDDERKKHIALTARGEKLLLEVESIYRELESGWARTIGQERLETLRRDLTAVMSARHGGSLPAVRPTW
jgi:DNA-binding MarR family transcriptional regulator